ncbi:mini-circle protein [Actinorhabdospora filicis]|uniref:Mini-circle protein n=1 Tax=Actinorhabdospora filicis TaxID=1785913 RepID=A0A9W6SSA5_9ACTN|nr:DUF664 domain-containing protein [Actinorhabdospora filicis]GLZ80912.1 mini-circle protein [Actinorhabdospora filicis]
MIELTTHFADTVPMPGEIETIVFALDRSRAQFAWKAGGLDAEALARRPLPSRITLGGLVKHLALVEELFTIDLTGEAPGSPLAEADHEDPDWAWRTAAEHTPDELYAMWRDAAAKSRAALLRVTADGGLDQPAKYWRNNDGETINLRRRMTDLHDEYARHVGHADLLREAVDGLVGEDPPR